MAADRSSAIEWVFVARSTEEILAFDDLIGIVLGFSSCEPGRRALRALAFSTDRTALEAGFAVIGEAVEYLGSGAELGFGALADPHSWLERLALLQVPLDSAQLLDAAGLIEMAADARRSLLALRERWPLLAGRGERLADLGSLAAAIRRAILPGGEISDDASLELKRLRASRARVRERTLQLLEAILRRLRESGGEEDYVTLRNERYVIPVRSSGRGAVPGVVHGSSSTGQTLFIEPLDAVESNNEQVRLGEAEAAEIARILEELTGRLREHRPALAGAAAALGELDSLFARARFARQFNCTLPRFPSDARLRLASARHPVLELALGRRDRSMVPITLELGGADTVMVISGPNAGGKTVVLKTVGLAVLAAQAGIPVAATDALLPVADAVLADIGDEQSITADLSTFSAHVLNLRSMLETATDRSLVLIDEIGTGTAPEEGSALAIALLDQFRARRSLSFVTTHHDRLKTYALAAPGVVNAAVEFDLATLLPTYRLLVGLPGTSSGIEIARRLGLPAEIIDRARREMTPEALEAASLIDHLHRSLEDLDELKRQAAVERLRLEEERTKLRTEWVQRQRRRVEELERQFRETLARAEKQIAGLASGIQDRKLRAAAEKQAARRLARIRAEGQAEADAAVLEQRAESQQDLGLPAEPAARPVEAALLLPGVRIRVRGLREPVVVRERRDRGVEIQAGSLRMKIPVDDVIAIIDEPGPCSKAGERAVTVTATEPAPASEEINVIGCTVEEAVRRVDRFLDRAVLAGKPRIRIVHGYGTGALRRGLAEFLRAHPLVDTITAETQEHGGEAVTVARLKG